NCCTHVIWLRHSLRMNSTVRNLALAFAVAGIVSVCAETRLLEARSTLDKWVETRQLISKTKSDWLSDKELLDQSIQLFERQLKSVEEQMAKLGTNNTQVEKERVQAEALRKTSVEALDQANQFAADFEVKLAKLLPQLPVPLKEILKPQLDRMPTNSVATK